MSDRARRIGGRFLVAALATLLVPFFVLSANAQERTEPQEQAIAALERAAGDGTASVVRSRSTGLATFLSAGNGRGIPVAGRDAAERAAAFIGRHGLAFGLPPHGQTRAVRPPERDLLGIEHVRVQQLHQGIPVVGAELSIHLRGASVVAANGKALPRLDRLPTVPLLTIAEARVRARALVERGKRTGATFSVPRLEILDRGFVGGPPAPAALAWFIEATAPGLREYIWIDARRGHVLLHFNQRPDALKRYVYTANDRSALPGTLLRSEGGAVVPPSRPEATDANAAYDFAGDTYNYFWTEHGRDSYDGKGAYLKSSVHYCPPLNDPDYQCPYPNAFWSGSQVVYGEGYAAADDVDAHELTHGVTEYSANLFYYMQSGALNESFSDIFGETVDLNNGAGTDTPEVRWKVGEDIPGGAIRNMMDPTEFGDPGKISDTQFKCWDSGFDDGGGVHSNSGVPNHAYALMVDGGTYGTYTINAIGLVKAGKIEYRALTVYLHSASDFSDARNAIQQSCSDLIGTSGITAADCTDVGNALDAVELDHPWPCTPAQPVEPDLCPTGEGPADIFADSLENLTSRNWATTVQLTANHWTGGAGSPAIYFDDFAVSPTHHFWGWGGASFVDSQGWDIPQGSSVEMRLPVSIPSEARMYFRHAYGFDNDNVSPYFYDGGVVEYTTDNGLTWLDAGSLISAGAAYSGTLPTDFGNPLGGRSAFVGDTWGYTASLLNLTSLANQSVRFRFRIGTDNAVSDYGWFIDDVRIYRCDIGGTVQFSGAEYSGSETTKASTITVTRTGGTAGGVTVDYQTVDGTAGAGSDYTASSGTLTFGSFATTRTFSVPIIDDTLDDDGETFSVHLSGVTGPSAALGAQSSADVLVTDNDVAGTLQFSRSAYSVNETGNAVITVTRTGGAASGVTVNYATVAGGTATAGLDYTAVSDTLSFGAGVVSRTFALPIVADTLDESNETIPLALSAPTGGGALGTLATATVTILDNDTAGTVQFSSSLYNVSEGAGSITIAATRSGGTASGVTVDYATAGGTATSGIDYTGKSGTLTFDAGVVTRTFTVPIIDDTLGENNETVGLTLSNPTGGAVLGLRRTATLTILENEAVLQFSTAAYSVNEAGVRALITVKRTGTTSSAVAVQYSTSDGTAQAASDYATSAGTLSFGPGVVTRTFSVPIINDTLSEGAESFVLELLAPSGPGVALGPTDTAVVTIADDDQAILQFGVATYTVSEKGPAAVITVRRTGRTTTAVSVDYGTDDGTATVADGDYATANGTLSFAAGVTTRTFTVTVTNDTRDEPNETVNLTLSTPSVGAALGVLSSGVLTITDDDTAGTLQLSSSVYSEGEGGGFAVITVTRSGGNASGVTVDYATSDGTAMVADGDYAAASGTLTFAAGETSRAFAVTITDDGLAETTETINLALSNPGGGGTLGVPSQAVLFIVDND